MTLKTDTEIICLPLPEIFSCFTYLLAVALWQFLVFAIFKPKFLSISCFVFIYLWSSIKSSYCSATSSRSPSMTSDASSLISRIALTTFAPLCNRIPSAAAATSSTSGLHQLLYLCISNKHILNVFFLLVGC